jgi:UDP-sugar transporter A1/2/3
MRISHKPTPTPSISIFGVAFHVKYLTLVLLVAQNTALVLTMRYSLVSGKIEDRYASTTAIACMEVMKLLICTAVVFWQGDSANIDIEKEQKKSQGLKLIKDKGIGFVGAIREFVVQSPLEMLKLTVPSILYTVQNNLLYVALKNLDAATYQVCYQCKILTTAVFSVAMLGKSLNKKKWFALVLLTIGVGLTQINPSAKKSSDGEGSPFIGFIAVFSACVTSGFAGVYFEKILKGSSTTLWVRNIQMGISATLFAFVGVYLSESEQVLSKGFFFGYNSSVIWSIVLQALGGLLVALVMKYADNILKGFATGISIISSCILSVIIFGFVPSMLFVIGAALVLIAVYFYST